MSISDVLLDDLTGFNNNSEIEKYDKDFLKLPTEIIESSEDIEIKYYFYFYSYGDGKDLSKQSMLGNIILDNFFMRRPDFLYMMIVRKFEKMDDNYQDFINNARLHFQFTKKTKEKIILKHLIHFYTDILKPDDKQLSVFTSVNLSKQIADLYSKILIEFFTLKLNALSPETDKYYVVAPEDKEAVRKVDKKTIYELPENFSLTEMGVKSQALDIRQTAALFYYLRKHHATIEYTDSAYSKLVHYLSGHSAENLRKRSGFGNIIEIFRETRGGVKYSNLKNVKSLLEKIISDIDKEIKE